jgi:hypothetical protein
LGIAIQGYTEWAIHHIKTYNLGWNGKPFDIYGCNPIGLSFDYTIWEIYIETEWYEFWKREEYVMTEP